MNMREKILIISFQFPPLGGVGTRRMVKFSKHLAMKEHDVHVLTIPWDVSMKNTYSENLESLGVRIHRVPSGCPHNYFQKQYPGNLTGRFSSYVQSLIRFSSRLLLYDIDYAQRWGKHLLPAACRLVRDNAIVNVLATGAPFTVNYWAAKLKSLCPQINLINDYRDMWNDDPMRSYYSPLHRKRAVAWEQYALDHSDWVTATTDQQVDLLRKRCKNPGTRFALIPNGYDPEDMAMPARRENPREFSLIYTGNIGNGRDSGFKNLLIAIQKTRETSTDFHSHFRLHYYGLFPQNIVNEFPDLSRDRIIVNHGFVSPREAGQAVANSFMALLINADIVPYAGSSKIYEYFSLGRPIFSITPPGWIDTIVKQYNLGCSLETNDIDGMVSQLLSWFDAWKNNPGFSIQPSPELMSRFSYTTIISRLESCFI